jgi:hypothetical protein
MNNNDQWTVYDFPRGELYWPYLNKFGITEHNVRQKFQDFALEPMWYHDPGKPTDPYAGWWQPPGEWDYFGGMEWFLHSDKAHTSVTGGRLAHGGDLITDDPAVGAVFDAVGDTFPGGTFNTPARMVDNNPDAFWSTAFYLKRFQLGTRSAPERYLSGPIEPNTYMLSRLFNLQYNLNRDGMMQIAGVGGTVLQGCIPKGTLHLEPHGSQLLTRLKDRLKDDAVLGLMVRCTVSMTRYFNLDEFACCDEIRDKYKRTSAQYRLLVQKWREELAAQNTPSANPAVSSLVGTIGLWHKTDPVTNSPGGRFLIPTASLPVPEGAWPGPAVAELDPTSPGADGKRYVTVDLTTTVPAVDSTGAKLDVGTLELNLVTDQTVQRLGSIIPTKYDQQAFQESAGIVDVELDPGVTDQAMAGGMLQLTCQTPKNERMVLLQERTITVQTEHRSVYIEQGQAQQITVEVRERGVIPQRDVEIRVKQYVSAPVQPEADGTFWQDPSVTPEKTEYVELGSETIVAPKGTGRAVLTLATVNPGCAVVAFFPKEQFPADLPPRIGLCPMPDGVAWGPSYESTPWTYYTCVRVLPFDNELPRDFIAEWEKSGRSPDFAWEYVYRRVLYLYDALYPVMRYFGDLDLGDRAVVDKNIDQIVELMDPRLRDANSTIYMPVSRELSAGKYWVLRMYRAIVHGVNSGADMSELEVPAWPS